MVPPSSTRVSRVPAYSGSRCAARPFAYGALTLSGWLSQNHSARLCGSRPRSFTPARSRAGLASSAFARRYLRNRCFFLLLALLRCFSSGGSPPYTMDSCMDAWSFSMRVSPFRHLRIIGYVLLPAAFRSLSRLSSALSAKASTLCSYLLDHCPLHSVASDISLPLVLLRFRLVRSLFLHLLAFLDFLFLDFSVCFTRMS